MADFNLTKTKLNPNWAEQYEKLIRSWKFQSIAHSDKPEDGAEAIWMFGSLMQKMLTKKAFDELLAIHDDDIFDAWSDLAGKLPAFAEQMKAD